jgi:hypothetical protein
MWNDILSTVTNTFVTVNRLVSYYIMARTSYITMRWLDQHAEFDYSSASYLKQQSTGGYVAPLNDILSTVTNVKWYPIHCYKCEMIYYPLLQMWNDILSTVTNVKWYPIHCYKFEMISYPLLQMWNVVKMNSTPVSK